MSINQTYLEDWCRRASAYVFSEEDAIYVCDQKLFQDTSFGINAEGFTILFLEEGVYESPFKIDDLIELTGVKRFVSDDSSEVFYGCGLIIRTASQSERIQVIMLLNNILKGNDYRSDLDSFLDLLRKASRRKRHFHAPSLFGELIVLKHLLSRYPDIIGCWQSGGQSIVDIRASNSNPPIEVKSTVNTDSRIHSLSLHQIRYFLENESCMLASVQVHEDESGTSCQEICEYLLKAERDSGGAGAKILTSYLVCYSEEPAFKQAKFNEASSRSSIETYHPIFTELDLMNPPVWLNAARFEIDFMSIPKRP